MFKEISKEKVINVEKDITKYWKSNNIFEKSLKGEKNFVFYDGPATANGMPGVHHMLAKIVKDSFGKYKTMKGYKVLRKVGWDTHGLPVEVQVEKELGFNGKDDIEKYGIEAFNKKCRESVWKNEDAFSKFTDRMGQFIDTKNAYITYNDNYIETEWWILKKFFDENLIYDGLKILPYCPRCETGLASHEVQQGYKEITVNTVTVPFKLKDQDNTYLLVWTTTPWTLSSNVAACVNPKELYVKCLSKGYNFIVAKKLVNKVLGDDYEVVEEYKGTDMEGWEYDQLLDFFPVDKKAFYITLADYVTMEDGTGIVHIAPAFGNDDYEVGLKYNLPVINPVNEKGCFTGGPWKDRLVVDPELEIDIIKYLKENDKMFKKQKMVHNYPHCWRCNTPLIYNSKNSLYIKATALKEKIIAENKKVNWHPDYIGEKRFGNWLENMNDWAISRNRYWGTPIPLWKCECGHSTMIGSKEELVERSIEDIDSSIELHRPYVDNIHIKCPICGKEMTRVKEVMDCWFDSGSMPFAQYHYPFENKELFESQYPADFIAEGVDQTRGWFYSLLVIGTFIMGKSPYKNVVVNDLVQGADGFKMHKSKGNAVDPFETFEEYGADATKWFMVSSSPVWTPLTFNVSGIKEVSSKFFNTFKNTYNFFAIYANADKVDPRVWDVPYEDRPLIDKWLLSKYNNLVKYVTGEMDNYNLTTATRAISDFVAEDLSNWYIRRNRKRFWKHDLDTDKKAVYTTTYEVLVGICELIAPIASFTAEDIYMKLTDKESVHLAKYPECNESMINTEIENKMDLVRDLISLGRNVREDAKIKVRQPIMEVLLDAKNKDIIIDLTSLIKEELNVKKITFVDDLSSYMNFTIKPNFKTCGPKFGQNIKLLINELNNLDVESINKLMNSDTVEVIVDGKTEVIDETLVDVRMNSKEGFDVASENNNFVILNTELTDELILEGIARELISKVQNLRKEKDYNIVDRITLYYNGEDLVKSAIDKFKSLIMAETLTTEIIEKDNLEFNYDLNGHEVQIDTKN